MIEEEEVLPPTNNNDEGIEIDIPNNYVQLGTLFNSEMDNRACYNVSLVEVRIGIFGNEDPDVAIDDEQNIVTSVEAFRKGIQYVDSDHVSEVFDFSDGSYHIAKFKCQSSFRKKVPYNVEIVLNIISGAVVRGSCECEQSSLGKCSHVTAFLICICRYVEKYGTVVMAPTCRPRKWSIGSRNRDPGQTSKSTYPMKRLKPLKRAEFDPRPKTTRGRLIKIVL
ncbi:hypothetical protein JTB14_025719 [Gonioctena quinquepunctata]|nr:hypothetical protein JTB14_025719 [Gonioctena quinquepunctata]